MKQVISAFLLLLFAITMQAKVELFDLKCVWVLLITIFTVIWLVYILIRRLPGFRILCLDQIL